MNITSIKHVQDRIKEIKSRFKTIQNTYTKVSYSQGMVANDSKTSQTNKVEATVPEINGSQKNNTANIKNTEEVMKRILNSQKESNKETIDVQQIQNLLQKAITQYTSNGKIFNIEE